MEQVRHVDRLLLLRRAAAPLLLLVGAILGVVWAHSLIGLAGAMWTAAALKVTILGAFFLWRALPKEGAR